MADPHGDLLRRVLVPVAEPDDAASTARALAPYAPGGVVLLHVIEKAGGAPDKASVEQREVLAAEAFDAFRETFDDDADLGTEIRYGTDIATVVGEAAVDHDVTAVVFVPRGGGRLIRLLTGDVALSLVTGTDRPVIALPRPDAE